MKRLIISLAIFLTFSPVLRAQPSSIGSLELAVGGLSAKVNSAVIPKNISSGVRISVSAGGEDLSAGEISRFLGGAFTVEGTLSGPGLTQTVDLPYQGLEVSTDPLLLLLPALPKAGYYTLENVRLVVNGKTALDVAPGTIEIIDQVLVTSVLTRALTLAEIQDKGITLTDSDYLGFQFDIGLLLSSQVVNISFPVVFDRQGQSAPMPLKLPEIERLRIEHPDLPVIHSVLLKGQDGGGNTNRPLVDDDIIKNIHIPAILVIPGDVGYLKQFFSAQLYVANGTPEGSNLIVHDVTAKITLPAGDDGVLGTEDDPLTLPDVHNEKQPETLPVLTSDGVASLWPGQTGQAEFFIRGEKEGYHAIEFDIQAVLDGLATGPVTVGAKTAGAVLVRNPYFDMTFITPGVVRSGNDFNLYVSVYNISRAIANDVSVTLNQASMSGAILLGDATQSIPTLMPGESQMLKFTFRSLRNGQVTASYLRLDTEDGSTGTLRFTLGVDSRNVPLSPDTLSLPATLSGFPADVIDAAMHVLGEAWGVANAYAGTLPSGVIRISKAVVLERALALAEAGLRHELGQPLSDVLKELAFDFWGGEPIDPGFDQLLRESAAGHRLTEVLGSHLFDPTDPMLQSGGPLEYQHRLSEIAVSGPEFILFTAASGLSAAPVEFSLTDRSGRSIEYSDLPGGVIFPLGVNGPVLGLLTSFDSPPYTLEMTGTASGHLDFAITVPRGDGNVIRASANSIQITQGQKLSLVVNAENHDGVQLYTNGSALIPLGQEVITPPGPKLVSATMIGQETFDGAGQYGFSMALLFDRVVDKSTASRPGNIVMPSNSIMSANRQLSGRFVFASLAQPEGPYVPTTVRAGGIADLRGAVGATETVNLQSRLQAPGTVVSGRVLNADGAPVPNAVVMFVGFPPSRPFMNCPQITDEKTLSSVLTDGEGFYEFRFVREGDCGNPYAIAVKDPSNGVLHSVRNFARYAGERLVYDFVFYGAGTVSGTVYDLSGQPVPEAKVYAMSVTDSQVSGYAVSDGDGRYTINGITVGAVTVRAVKGNGLGLAAGHIESAGSTATINVTLDSGAVQVSGTVRQTANGSELTPVPGVPVTFYTSGTPVGYSITGHDGTYSISDMPVGPYRVFTGLNTRDTAEVQGVAAAGDHLRIDLTVVPGAYGTAEGHVRFPDGEPAAEALVYSGKSGVIAEADGSFSLPWISVNPSVSQTITARTLDGKRNGQTSVIINTPDQVVKGLSITLSGLGMAQFTVLDSAGLPVRGQSVQLFNPYDPCNGESSTTDSKGQATFSNLGMGTVRAKAVMRGNGFIDVAEGMANVVQDGLTAFGTLRFNGSGTVSGRVLNPDGGPSHGALVDLISKVYDPQTCTLSSSTSVAQQFTTGTNGNFQFRGVPVGSVGVRASQPFFPTRVSANGTLSANGDTVNFTLQLVDTISGELSGTVFMPDGVTPAGSGVEVTINGPLPDITVLTNAEGRFAFARILPSGRYDITARDSVTGGIVRETIVLKSEQDFKDLRLKGTGTVRVEIVDGAGMPVESAVVKLRETDFPNESYDGVLSPADHGVLSFDNVFEGPFNVTVADGFGRGGRAAAVLPPLTDSIDVKVQITATGTVKGHFLHHDGSPIPHGIVTLTAGGRIIGNTVTSGSDDIGAYSFDYVPAGTVSVSAQDPVTARTGHASATLETEGQILILDVIEGNIGTVEGTVTSNGEPQAGVTVTLVAGRFNASVTTDSSGQYSISGIPEGNVTASSSLGNGFLKGTASGILRGEGTVLTLDVALRASGEVAGQVFEHDGVTPASLSVVTIEVGGTGGGKVVTTTDAESRFAFARVPSGSGTITVEKPASADRGRAYVVVPENDTVDVNITLAGTGAIAGLSLDSARQPVGGTITLTGTGDFPYSYTLTANADGTFHVPDVIAGPFDARLRANIGGLNLYGTTSGVVTPDETLAFEIQLESSGTVAGVVMRADGLTPAAGAEVTIRMQAGSSIKIQVQADGRFTVVGVPASAFSVHVYDALSGGIGLLEGLMLTDSGETVNVGIIVLSEEDLAVITTDPVDGETDVAVDKTITVVFNNPLRNANGITVMQGNKTVGMKFALSEDGRTVSTVPLSGNLPDDSDLTLNIANVTDFYGRRLLQPYQIRFRTVDLTGPSVVAITPADQAIQVDVSTHIIVTFSEDLLDGMDLNGVVTLKGPDGETVPGQTVLNAPDKVAFIPSMPLSDNSRYTVTVSGTMDVYGNMQSAPFTSSFMTPDTNTPVLEMTSPNRFTNNTRPSICVRLTNTLTGIDKFELRLDGEPVTASSSGGGTQRCYTPSAPLVEGEHLVEAEATNQAGNTGTLSAAFTVDVTPPGVAAILNLTADQILQGSYTFTASAMDDLSGVARIELYSNGSRFLTLNAPDFSASYDMNRLGDGTYNITARATDNVGNVGQESAPVRVHVSYTALSLTITSPAANAILSAQAQVAATANKAVEKITFTLGGQSVQVESSPYAATFDLKILPDGVHTITVTATGAVPGETASATRSIVVDNTPPAPPDASRISAEPAENGTAIVHGSAGAVEGQAVVRITHLATGNVFSATAAANGSFTSSITAEPDDMLSLVAVDAAGNISAPSTIAVRRTSVIPPVTDNTSLYYEGLAVDRVGLTAGEYAPDGEMDAVFTLTLDIGEGITRTISYIELSNGSAIRSTRTGDTPLGVADDPGSPLMNGDNGTVSFSMTSDGTLSLIAGDDGFIAEGLTYTATAVFADGAHFVASYRIIPAADKALVAHSATVTASPAATVVVSAKDSGHALLTIENIRDIDGVLVPDGAKIAVTAANMASADPFGVRYTSAGGTISGGVPAANNPDFQVFTIENGKVTAWYDSAPVTPAEVIGAQALVQMQAADSDGNILGIKAIATMDINIRASTDQALVAVSPTQLYADGADRRAVFTIVMHDEAGTPVPDGTPVLVSAANCAARNASNACISSVGGQIIGGQTPAAGNNYRLFFTADGRIEGEYSSKDMSVSGQEVSNAVIQILTSTDTGAIISNRAIGTAILPLTGMASMVIDVIPDTIPYVFFTDDDAHAQIIIHQIIDQRSGLVPDGGRMLISAANCAARNASNGCISSVGGNILEGDASTSGSAYRVLTVYQGRATATYSVSGVTSKPAAGEAKIANIQTLMSDYKGGTITNRAVQWTPLQLLGPGNAVGVASPSSLLGDGGLNTSTITFGPILDAYGHVFPDEAKVVVSVSDCASRNTSNACISSAGGQILNGEASPSGNQYKVFTVRGGKVTVEYGSQGITAKPGQVKTANVVLLPADSDGSYLSNRAVSTVSIQIAGLTSAVVTAIPSSIFADYVDHRSVVTLTDFRDALGQPVPDGAMIAVSAEFCFAFDADDYCIDSDGGDIIGGIVPSWAYTSVGIFTIANGQVVFEYSSQGVFSEYREQTAVIQAVSITPQSLDTAGYNAFATVPIQLLSPGSAVVELRPGNLLADGSDQRSQVIVSGLMEPDGVTPIPDGVKIGLTAAECEFYYTMNSYRCMYSDGGTILSAGTSPDDGTVDANNVSTFTIAGGQVQAIYSNKGITAAAGQIKTVHLFVSRTGIDGDILNRYNIATREFYLHGVTNTAASGPESISRSSGNTATVTFSGILDAAGNPVPDGTLVLASAANCASTPLLDIILFSTSTSDNCHASVGGTIVDGAASPTGNHYKVFAVKDGSVTVAYAPGESNGTARIQLIPADPDGRIIGNYSLRGGVWEITVTD